MACGRNSQDTSVRIISQKVFVQSQRNYSKISLTMVARSSSITSQLGPILRPWSLKMFLRFHLIISKLLPKVCLFNLNKLTKFGGNRLKVKGMVTKKGRIQFFPISLVIFNKESFNFIHFVE